MLILAIAKIKSLGWLTLTAVIAALVAYGKGIQSEKQKTELRDLRRRAKTEERIDHADVGIGATDRDTAEWLRRFQDKHGRR